MSPMLVSILAQISAANARVAGMVAENQHRLSIGQSVAYAGDSFFYEANELSALAEAARAQTE